MLPRKYVLITWQNVCNEYIFMSLYAKTCQQENKNKHLIFTRKFFYFTYEYYDDCYYPPYAKTYNRKM